MYDKICLTCQHYDGKMFCEFYEVSVDSNGKGYCSKHIPTAESLPKPVRWDDCGNIDFLASIKELRRK